MTGFEITSTPGNTPGALTPRLARLRSIGRRLFRLPVLKWLKPVARSAWSVASLPSSPQGRDFPRRVTIKGEEHLTVLSANLWHDWPQHRRLPDRLEAFARLVEEHQADIVLLQEVARTPHLHADEWLAERLGMAYLYARANGHRESAGFEEGVAIFSRFPLKAPRLRKLKPGVSPFVRRVALGAEVDTHLGKLLAYSAHLGFLPGLNAAQLADLRGWVDGQSEVHPALIGGDFNSHEKSPQIAKTQRSWLDVFRQLHPRGDGATFEWRLPCGLTALRQRFDYLFLKPGERCWRVLEAAHLFAPGGPHSDHRAVLARLAPVPCEA